MYRLRRTRCRRGHSRTTCLAVSHCAPQQQAGVGKPGTCRLQRKAASPILPVRICVKMLLWALDRPARSRRDARYGILSGFQPSPPPGSGSSSWIRGGGPPWSSCHLSQHHCSDSRRACQTVRGGVPGGGVTAGWLSAHGGRPRDPLVDSSGRWGQRIDSAQRCRAWYSASILQPAVSFPRLDLGSVVILTHISKYSSCALSPMV